MAVVGDDDQERRQVHAVGSAAANVGAVRLESAARLLESALLSRLSGSEAPIDEALRRNLVDEFRQAWGVAGSALSARRQGRSGRPKS